MYSRDSIFKVIAWEGENLGLGNGTSTLKHYANTEMGTIRERREGFKISKYE